MGDLYLALSLIALLSIGLFVLAYHIGNRVPPRTVTLLALLCICLIIFYGKHIQESPLLAKLLPFSSVMILGNWFPLGGAFLAGLAWTRIPGRRWRKCLSIIPLCSVCLYSSYNKILGAPPETGDYFREGVCRQTSFASCSAASAATLLRAHGIPATETEMAELCLTRNKGTTWFGLYRGLKLKTAGTPWDVEVFSCSLEELMSQQSSPAILSVRLDPYPGIDPRYVQSWGWLPGVQHAVVLFKFMPNGRVDMGDPATGREFWNLQALNDLWHGDGMRLVPREPRFFASAHAAHQSADR